MCASFIIYIYVSYYYQYVVILGLLCVSLLLYIATLSMHVLNNIATHACMWLHYSPFD